MEITLETVRQAASASNLSIIDAITMMQAGAAKLGDEKILDRLCEIKFAYIEGEEV